jgi:membrane protein required for colicin V production
MIIDILLLIVLVSAIVKGLKKGLVVAVFSLLSFIIGLAAALKLSATVARILGEKTNITAQWLPVVSFLVVFVGVVLLVRLFAKMIEQALEFSMMGWLNKLGAVVFYCLLHLFIFSIALFYADQLHFISEETRHASVSFSLLQPLAPTILEWLAYLLPFMKGVFSDLQDFFGKFAQKNA